MLENCVSLHVHYEGDRNVLLKECCFEVVGYLQRNELLEGWFFIRYSEFGPHIRLRLLAKEGAREQVLQHATAAIERYLKARPSAPDAVEKGRRKADWLPTDTVQVVPLEPELARYGGAAGYEVVLCLFELSSFASLSVIKLADEWDEHLALNSSLVMQLAIAKAVGLERSNLAAFFDAVARPWLPFAADEVAGDEVLSAYQERFEADRAEILEVVNAYWEMACAAFDNPTEGDLISNFVNGTAQYLVDYVNGLSSGAIVARDETYLNPYFRENSPMRMEIMQLLSDLIHLTNNRLGVPNDLEAFASAYLAYGFSAKR